LQTYEITKSNNSFERIKNYPWRWRKRTETCRRKCNNQYTYCIVYVHFLV